MAESTPKSNRHEKIMDLRVRLKMALDASGFHNAALLALSEAVDELAFELDLIWYAIEEQKKNAGQE